MSKELYESYLSLVRLGIGHDSYIIKGYIEWDRIYALASQQGLLAVVLDGIENKPNVQKPPQETLLNWIGEVLQTYEQRYEAYQKAIGSLASFYNQQGFKMMLIKGYACGICWPNPIHRPYGDIDIWMFGEQERADALMRKEKGIKVDTSHHHHTTFEWEGFLVENHYDFVNTKDLKSSKSMEKVFKELGQDDSYCVEIEGERVYMPSPNLHALFLMRHLALHFASVSVDFRQLIDWAFFIEKHTKEINWSWLIETLKKYHMLEFYNCINAICVGDLGFDVNIFPKAQFNPNLKDRVLEDIMNPQFVAEEPRCIIRRLRYKYVRWQGNAWKQNLCFGENRFKVFWMSLWAHLAKPKSL